MRTLLYTKGPVLTGLFISTIFLIGFSGCFSREPELHDQAVLKIEDQSFTLRMFSEELVRRMRHQPVLTAKNQDIVDQTKDAIVRDFVIEAIIARWAKKNGLDISEVQLNQEVEKTRTSYPSDIAFRKALASENISFNEWKSQLSKDLLKRVVLEKVAATVKNPSEEEARKYYEDNKERFKRAERIKLRQLVTKEEGIARTLLEKLKPSNFAEMAKRFSIAPEAENGGQLDWIEKGTLQVFDEAFSLPTGRVSDVYSSPYGHHIFLVESKAKADVVPFLEAKAQIESTLLLKREQEVFSHWLEGQMQGTKVWKNDALIRATKVEFTE